MCFIKRNEAPFCKSEDWGLLQEATSNPGVVSGSSKHLYYRMIMDDMYNTTQEWYAYTLCGKTIGQQESRCFMILRPLITLRFKSTHSCLTWAFGLCCGSHLKFRPSVNFQFTQCKKSRKTMTALASRGKWYRPDCKLSAVRRFSNLCRIQFQFLLFLSTCTISLRSYRSFQVWVPVLFFRTYLQGSIMQH